MVMLPSASCGSLGVPRRWPLSPVAAETCSARWDTGASKTAGGSPDKGPETETSKGEMTK